VVFAEFLKLLRKLTYLFLNYLNTTVIFIIIEGVTRNDKILRDIGAMLFNTVQGDEVGILRNYRGSLLVHSTLPIAVDVIERLGHYSD
jgi:hypothetical protein